MSSPSKCLFPVALFFVKACFLCLAFVVCFPVFSRAQLVVDCTGATPGAFTTINAALPSAGPGAFILVTGPCTENASLNGQTGLNLGAFYGQTAAIKGTISISNSQNLFLYGLNVTNPAGDGISVSNSRSIVLNVCASSGNAGIGLRVSGMSDVTIGASGAFSHNAGGGMNISGNSLVALVAWAGPVDISNNSGPGVWESGSRVFTTLGPTHLYSRARHLKQSQTNDPASSKFRATAAEPCLLGMPESIPESISG